MQRPQLGLRAYRRWAGFMSLLSLALTVAGLYAALKGQWLATALGVGGGVVFLYLVQRVTIRPEPGSEWQLVFVTKKECSLCDEARLVLPTLTRGTPFQVEEVRVETDKLLRRHFKNSVPVLLWQGEVLAQLRWDPASLGTRLREIAARHPEAISGAQRETA